MEFALMRTFYLIGAILGFILPYIFFIQFLTENGLNLALFVQQMFTSPIAGFFSMHVTTLEKKLASDELLDTKHGQMTLRELMEIGRAKGRISIRRQQMTLLEKGNATMAIWLGKNLLGQSDDGPVGGYNPPVVDDDDLELDP